MDKADWDELYIRMYAAYEYAGLLMSTHDTT
jgi:hypothetical protein